MIFKLATDEEVFPIINLYQKSLSHEKYDPLYLNYKKLQKAITIPNSLWMIAEETYNNEKKVLAVIALLIENEQHVSKITHMMVDPSLPNSKSLLRDLLKHTLHYLYHVRKNVDLVYTSTLTMTLDQQAITLEEGFRILGVFPNIKGEDSSALNGLSTFYFPNVLEGKRVDHFLLHPTIAPFYNISARECGLSSLPVESRNSKNLIPKYDQSFYEGLPDLEIISAPNFVLHRFYKHKKDQTQQVSFYPFYEPNLLITDPKQQIEIFCKTTKEMDFAAIIGEHLTLNVNPMELYNKVQTILKSTGITYIEIINDASDTFGIDCILKSGFTPCAYFPAFKKQGSTRRDYVIFGKSFEYLCRPTLDAHPSYIDFYREYYKIEGKHYFPSF